MGAVTAPPERHIAAGAGTPETSWQAWPGLHALPSVPLDHWLPAGSRLVVVAPHPDDEVLACGGLLALHAARGGEISIVAATDGEASHPGVAGWTPPQLAAARRAESARGLAALGLPLASVLRLGLPDGALTSMRSRLAQQIAATLQPGDRLLSTWRWDGHPDHEACAQATLAAGRLRHCAVAQAPVWMWHWAAPGDAAVPWHRLHALPLPKDVQGRKAQALAAHESQHARRLTRDAVDLGPVLDAAILQRAKRASEYFFLPTDCLR